MTDWTDYGNGAGVVATDDDDVRVALLLSCAYQHPVDPDAMILGEDEGPLWRVAGHADHGDGTTFVLVLDGMKATQEQIGKLLTVA